MKRSACAGFAANINKTARSPSLLRVTSSGSLYGDTYQEAIAMSLRSHGLDETGRTSSMISLGGAIGTP